MRAEPDTHCSRCGGPLRPVPSFTVMKWECDCATRPTAKDRPRMGTFRELHAIYGPGMKFRLLLSGPPGAYAKTDTTTGDYLAFVGGSFPVMTEDLIEIVD